MLKLLLFLAAVIIIVYLLSGKTQRSDYRPVPHQSPSCKYLASLGYDDPTNQILCEQYSKGCGDASNRGFIDYSLANIIPPVEVHSNRQFLLAQQYKQAIPLLPPNENGYCYTPYPLLPR